MIFFLSNGEVKGTFKMPRESGISEIAQDTISIALQRLIRFGLGRLVRLI